MGSRSKDIQLRKPSFIDPAHLYLGALRYDSKDDLPDMVALKKSCITLWMMYYGPGKDRGIHSRWVACTLHIKFDQS